MLEETQEPQVLQAREEIQDQEVLLEQMEELVQLDHLEMQELREHLANKVQQDQEVNLELVGIQEQEVT